MAPFALPPVEIVANATFRAIVGVTVRPEASAASEPRDWMDLAAEPRDPGGYVVRLTSSAPAVRIPVCAGRGLLTVDGRDIPLAAGPVVVRLPALPANSADAEHVISLHVRVSGYERRIACGQPIIAGDVVVASPSAAPAPGVLEAFDFPSPHAAAGGGHAVVYIPPNHNTTLPGPLLVGLHPWNGTMWTYAAYQELISEAARQDVVLLFPSGLGNSLYTAPAEDEAMRAIAALEDRVAIDPQRVSLWGASMGGAGATTVGFHHPDKFARITSFFGDSDYDLGTYVHSILHDQDGAHRVNALDVADNVRNVPVWLIHGTADKVSSIVQSERLDGALRHRQFSVRFDRVEGRGHEGGVVAIFIQQVVDNAATDRAPVHPTRVSYVSVRPEDLGAYGVHLTKRTRSRDARIDVERRADGIHVLRAENVTRITFDAGALGSVPGANEAVHRETGVPTLATGLEIPSPP